MTNKKILTTKRGFTLIETLMAILVLTIAIAGPLTIAGKGLNVALISKDQLTATYLAQDGLEYVRFLRDSNRLSNTSWLTNLGGCVPSGSIAGCYLDSTGQSPAVPTSCGTTCPAMYYNPTANIYWYSSVGSSVSLFTRTVTITTPVGGNANEASVVVTVSWLDSGRVTRSVSVQENMLNWQ